MKPDSGPGKAEVQGVSNLKPGEGVEPGLRTDPEGALMVTIASNSRNNAVVCDDRESLIPITSSHDLTEAQLSSADMRMAIQQTGELFRKKTLL